VTGALGALVLSLSCSGRALAGTAGESAPEGLSSNNAPSPRVPAHIPKVPAA
jgi:hypothetical protein